MNTRTSSSSAFLASVDRRLAEVLEPTPADRDAEVLVAAARNLVLAGGKRARPWLVYTLGSLVDSPPDGLLDVAVTAELIHAASLLHDDVIDQGTLRRGRPTANALWGNLAAVLSGDLLLTIALRQLRPHAPRLQHEAIDTIAVMTRASLLEAACRGRLDISTDAWWAIAVGKTAELFGWCGLSAALLADQEDASDRFRRACRHLGVAFQLANDLDDLYGRTPGKDPLADVLNQNPSYPVLLAVSRSEAARARVEAAWGRAPSAELGATILAAIEETGAARATWESIGDEVRAAYEALGPFAEHPAAAPVLAWADRLWRQAGEPASR